MSSFTDTYPSLNTTSGPPSTPARRSEQTDFDLVAQEFFEGAGYQRRDTSDAAVVCPPRIDAGRDSRVRFQNLFQNALA